MAGGWANSRVRYVVLFVYGCDGSLTGSSLYGGSIVLLYSPSLSLSSHCRLYPVLFILWTNKRGMSSSLVATFAHLFTVIWLFQITRTDRHSPHSFRTVHMELSSASIATQLQCAFLIPSWAENWTAQQSLPLACSWLCNNCNSPRSR